MARRITAKSLPDRQGQIYGYCRVSSQEQANHGISLDEQQRRIQGRCPEQGWTLSELFIEGGVSGSVPFSQRPQGSRLIRRLLPGDILISPKLDRMFRSALDALTVIRDLQARQISLWLLDIGDCSGNGVAKVVITILASIAEFGRERLSERLLDAKRELRRTGRHLGGSQQFGYRLAPAPVGSKGRAPVLIPDEKEQAAIREIVRLRDAGLTLRRIKSSLATVHGFKLSHQTISNIIERERLAEAAA
jgi:DNA invertase Pin-like site-specific DNA recombinase